MSIRRILITSVAAVALAAAVAQPAAAGYHHNAIVGGEWAVIGIGAAAASIILNGIIVSSTQCREMTSEEAWTAALPVVGLAINSTRPVDNHCVRH
ncbi:MAG: hypothetical protein P4L82_08495 [Ancalomicrobiaceae bacterium]|nr:hypothetical protein [Ancalomicrobiaceae bacterium]